MAVHVHVAAAGYLHGPFNLHQACVTLLVFPATCLSAVLTNKTAFHTQPSQALSYWLQQIMTHLCWDGNVWDLQPRLIGGD